LLQATAYVEREVAKNFGVRTGFVWNAWQQGYGETNVNEPFGAFNVPVTVTDPGPNGKTPGQTLTAFGLNPAYVGLPVNQVVENLPHMDSDYYTWEISATRRMSNRWSLMASFYNTWADESPLASAQNPTLPPYNSTSLYTPNTFINTKGGLNVYSTWAGKVTATYTFWRALGFRPFSVRRVGRGLPEPSVPP
jgi:hypothetical protein